MSLALALAGVSAATTLGSFAYNRYKNNKRKKFGDSAYGQELKRVGEEGSISQKARNIVVGGSNRASAGVAQTGKASYAGRLASQGLEGSVAGQRGMNEFDIQRQSDASRTSERVDLANEQSKVEAKLSYAEQKLQDERQREELQRANTNQLISGIGDIATSYIGNKLTTELANTKSDNAFDLKLMEQLRQLPANEREDYMTQLRKLGMI